MIKEILFESKGHCSANHKSLDMHVRNSSPGFCLSLTLNLIDHLDARECIEREKIKLMLRFDTEPYGLMGSQ